MKRLEVLHIYSGTSGSAGLYIDEIYKSLRETVIQECLVNYYFPFSYGKKIFYKFTEMSGKNRLAKAPRLRLILRMLELSYALFFAFFYIVKNKPKVINYSFTSNLLIEYLFLYLVRKLTSSTLILTCHDIKPFNTGYSRVEDDIQKRKKFFRIAHKLLVHNENSRIDLRKVFEVPNDEILIHRFPVMDLNVLFGSLKNQESLYQWAASCEYKYLFVGHLRKEKGIDTLLEAWSRRVENSCLLVAGNIPTGFSYSIGDLGGKSFRLIDRFLTDSEYAKVISESDFVVLPYTSGSNSGIPSSVISLGVIPIVSDIDMFRNNELINKDFLFKSGCVESLYSKLSYFSSLGHSEVESIKKSSTAAYREYRNAFVLEVRKLYRSVLERND